MRLSSHDASFLYTETASGPMHGIGLSVLDGEVSFEELFEFYAQRIHLVPRLRQKLAYVPFNLAHPKWIDDPEFSLENHFKKHVVPPNTNLKRAFEIGLELGEPLLDRSRPLWLTYVLENIEGKTVLVQLSHHAFVDGATAVAMTTVLTDTSPDAAPPEPPAEPWSPAPEPTPFQLWQEAVTENAQVAAEDAQRVLRDAPKLAELNTKAGSLLQRMSRPVMQAPWNASLVGPKRAIVNLEFTMDDFRPVRQALGGKVNDIVVSIVVEGAARYLVACGESVENQYLRLMCPVDVRDEGDDPLDMSGNRVSAMFPVLAAWPLDMADRYAQTRAELDEIKTLGEPQIMDQLQHLQPNVPPVAMAQAQGVGTQFDPTVAVARAPLPILPFNGGQRPQQLGFNFTCTNVPGPTWAQYVCGREVLSAIGTLMLGGNLGFGVGINSFNGKFNMTFTADPRLVPELDQMADSVSAALRELQELAAAETG